MIKTNIKSVSAACCLLALSAGANAATITWGAAVDISATVNTSDLISGTTTTITDHDRFNAPSGGTAYQGVASGSDLTGVTFNDGVVGTPGGGATFTSTNLAAALDGFDSGSNGNNTGPVYADNTLTYDGLIAGTTYQIQLFFSDQRASSAGREYFWSDTAVTTLADLTDVNANYATLNSSGQYVIGTFVADGTGQQQVFGIGSSDGGTSLNLGGDLSLSAITAVPEPSSSAMLLGGLGLLTMLRRRS
ncbi:PEP-CTERM sorting domain-containing protein [Rubritalea sp.]|uniref:PEP-CTERM sorting domain-containing protein n=1 Tax=Rubritalea sp. TaxID=2109375 RepID=UPI003EF9E3A5